MVVGCGSQEIKIEPPELELADFTSDGCSLFIDGTFENPELWKDRYCGANEPCACAVDLAPLDGPWGSKMLL